MAKIAKAMEADMQRLNAAKAWSELSGGLGEAEDLITCLWCGSSTPHETAVGACCWEEWKRQVDDLAMMTRRFVHAIRKVDPDNKMARQAMDYLKRKNLQGSVLR